MRNVEADGEWLTETDNEPGTGPLEMRIWVMHKDDHYFEAGGITLTPTESGRC